MIFASFLEMIFNYWYTRIIYGFQSHAVVSLAIPVEINMRNNCPYHLKVNLPTEISFPNPIFF